MTTRSRTVGCSKRVDSQLCNLRVLDMKLNWAVDFFLSPLQWAGRPNLHDVIVYILGLTFSIVNSQCVTCTTNMHFPPTPRGGNAGPQTDELHSPRLHQSNNIILKTFLFPEYNLNHVGTERRSGQLPIQKMKIPILIHDELIECVHTYTFAIRQHVMQACSGRLGLLICTLPSIHGSLLHYACYAFHLNLKIKCMQSRDLCMHSITEVYCIGLGVINAQGIN
jgi:hypothetical protein